MTFPTTVTIYMATLPGTGQRYIGRTSKPLRQRAKEHLRLARIGRDTEFYEAIRELEDPEAIQWEELWKCPKGIAARAEHLHIAEFGTLHPGGLNLPDKRPLHYRRRSIPPAPASLAEWKKKMEAKKWCPGCEKSFDSDDLMFGAEYHEGATWHTVCVLEQRYEDAGQG